MKRAEFEKIVRDNEGEVKRHKLEEEMAEVIAALTYTLSQTPEREMVIPIEALSGMGVILSVEKVERGGAKFLVVKLEDFFEAHDNGAEDRSN